MNVVEHKTTQTYSLRRIEMESRLLSVDEAANALSIGKTKLYSELKLGRIRGVKLGKRTFITPEEIKIYISTLETYPFLNQETVNA